MTITIRKTHAFIELKVDETETTIFKSYPIEIQQTIDNLLSVIDDLSSFTDKTLIEHAQNYNQ